MAHPCWRPRASVRRISRSRVPCGRSICGVVTRPLSLLHERYDIPCRSARGTADILERNPSLGWTHHDALRLQIISTLRRTMKLSRADALPRSRPSESRARNSALVSVPFIGDQSGAGGTSVKYVITLLHQHPASMDQRRAAPLIFVRPPPLIAWTAAPYTSQTRVNTGDGQYNCSTWNNCDRWHNARTVTRSPCLDGQSCSTWNILK